MLNSAYTKPLNLELYCNWIALYINQRLEKCFEVTENVIFSWRKYLKQNKFSKTGQDLQVSISNAILNLRATKKQGKILRCFVKLLRTVFMVILWAAFKFILDMETCRYISFVKKLKCVTLFSYKHEKAVDFGHVLRKSLISSVIN